MAKNYGNYHINPAGKRGRKRKARGRRRLKNPFGIVLVNPSKRKKSAGRKRSSSSKRRRRALTVKRKSILSASVQTKNPKMKKRRSGRRRNRNPSRRRNRRRSSMIVIRNPARGRKRSRSRRMRNPVGVVTDIVNSNTLTLGAGIVTAQVGTNLVLNKLRRTQMATQGSLPGLKPGQESALAIMIYKLAIGAGAGYLLRNQSPRFSQGLIVGAVAGALSDLLMQSKILQTAGVGRYYGSGRPGAGAYLPGTSTRFTGPASQFLQNSVPRPGMGAAVRPGFVQRAENMSEGAFRGAN